MVIWTQLNLIWRFYIMNYNDFSTGNLLVIDNDGFPINLTVRLMFEDDEIRFYLMKGINSIKNFITTKMNHIVIHDGRTIGIIINKK